MKAIKISYWVVTGLLSAMYLMSASMYVFQYDTMSELFTTMGFPTFIIYPLAGLKLAGVLVLLTQKKSAIKEWVYSAMFFNLLFAFGAHVNIGDGQQGGAIMAMILLLSSYFLGKKLFNQKA